MTNNKAVKFGFGLCIVGFVMALIGLIPALNPAGNFPWMICFGSAIYLPGAFLAFLNAKGKSRNQIMMWLRLIRLGFFVILVGWTFLATKGIH